MNRCFSICFAGFLFVGCGGHTEPTGGAGGNANKRLPTRSLAPSAVASASPAPSRAPIAPDVPVGTVIGVVKLAEGATLPLISLEPRREGNGARRPPRPAECSPASPGDREPVKLVDGHLVGVLVAAADFHGVPHADPQVHPVEIRDCRLFPRILVATVGDTLHLTNETSYPFIPTLGGGLHQALLHGQTRDFVLDHGSVAELSCVFAADCGKVDLIVLSHPVHATTDEHGEFRLTNVPAGQDVMIHAWHPLFRDAAVHARVEAGGEQRVELVLTPAPPVPEASPEPLPPGAPF